MKITGFESNKELLLELGSRIREKRIDLGLTQNQLAKKAGVSLRTIINLESGKDVSFSVVMNVLRVLNISSNFDILIPETLTRPYDYLKLKKHRERVRNNKKGKKK